MEWRFNGKNYYRLAQLINSERKFNIKQLCKETGFVQSHLSVVGNWWLECGIITKEQEGGMDTYIHFTEFGKEVFKTYDKFAQLANRALKNREKLMEQK